MCKKCSEINTKNIADQIYDTLFGNVRMREHHVPFDTSKVKGQWVNGEEGVIEIFYAKGRKFTVTVQEVAKGE